MPSFETFERRKIFCAKCKKDQIEIIFGNGFPGWLKLHEIFKTQGDPKTPESPCLCPDCIKLLMEWLDSQPIKKEVK